MKNTVIKIDKSGTMTYLASDNLNLALKNEGRMRMKRASDVSWDDDAQQWFVYYPKTNDKMLPQGFDRREDALRAEVEYLEQRL